MNRKMVPDFFCHVRGLEKCACVRVMRVYLCMTELQGKPHSCSLHGFMALPKIFPEEINMMPNLVTLETQRQRWLFAENVFFSDSNNGSNFDIYLWRQLHRTKPKNEM